MQRKRCCYTAANEKLVWNDRLQYKNRAAIMFCLMKVLDDAQAVLRHMREQHSDLSIGQLTVLQVAQKS